MSAVFVTGTDTGVGKSLVSAWLCAHWQADYWKPIQSGLEDATDSQSVQALSKSRCWPEAYRLKAPLSPNQSAELEGCTVELKRIKMPKAQRLVVEGAGGLLVPLNNTQTMLDLIVALSLPVVVVARSGLGTLNHTGLTVRALRDAGLDLLGVILNGPPNPMNRRDIEHHSKVPVLAEIPALPKPSYEALLKIPAPAGLLGLLESDEAGDE